MIGEKEMSSISEMIGNFISEILFKERLHHNEENPSPARFDEEK